MSESTPESTPESSSTPPESPTNTTTTTMESSSTSRRMSGGMIPNNGERVDIDGQFNPNNILQSFYFCNSKAGSSSSSSSSSPSVPSSVTKSIGIIREQLPKQLQEKNWNSFCDDVDLELSKLEKMKWTYYPLSSALIIFLLASVMVWVPIIYFHYDEFLLSVEDEHDGSSYSFHLWYYLAWSGMILVPSIAYAMIRFHMSSVSHLVWKQVRDLCAEKSIMNVIRYELHEEKWGRYSFGCKRFIIVRYYDAQNRRCEIP